MSAVCRRDWFAAAPSLETGESVVGESLEAGLRLTPAREPRKCSLMIVYSSVLLVYEQVLYHLQWLK